MSGIVNRPCLDVDNLSVQGDVPTLEAAIEECVEAVQIIPRERISECIAEQENRRLGHSSRFAKFLNVMETVSSVQMCFAT